MKEPLKISVVGLGRIGWKFHFENSRSLPNYDLISVVDPLDSRLAEARELSECRTYKNFNDIWKHDHPHVIAIAAPTNFHERMTRKALREGSHVILEKPMTTSLKSADRMIAEAEKCGRKIFVYQPHRLTRETQAVQDIIRSGIIGPVYSIRRAVYRYRRRNDWQSLRKNGGGMLNNYGAHYLDQVVSLSDGSPIVDVRCSQWAIATVGDADDVVKVWLKTEEGQHLEVEINQASAIDLPPWHICGKYGTAVLDNKAFHLRYYDPQKAPVLDVVDGAAPNRSYENNDQLPWVKERRLIADHPQLDFYQNVFEVIREGAEPHIKIEESRELMRIAEVCRRRSKF